MRLSRQLLRMLVAWPIPVSTVPATMQESVPAVVLGTGFFGQTGEVHLGDGALWSACTETALQPVDSWSSSSIHIEEVTPGEVPLGGAWLYVCNTLGKRNVAGLLVYIEGPAK